MKTQEFIGLIGYRAVERTKHQRVTYFTVYIQSLLLDSITVLKGMFLEFRKVSQFC